MSAPAKTNESRPWYHLTLGKQMVLGLIVGTIVGWGANTFYMSGIDANTPLDIAKQAQDSLNDFMAWVALIRDVFLHLIQMMIAPLVFASIVQGIAGHEDMKKVGRIGVKALVYFEVITTLALVVGLFMVNVIHPGKGSR